MYSADERVLCAVERARSMMQTRPTRGRLDRSEERVGRRAGCLSLSVHGTSRYAPYSRGVQSCRRAILRSKMEQADFFISYNKADVRWATGIGDWLDRAGYSTILQAQDFVAGSNIVSEMHRAVQQG